MIFIRQMVLPQVCSRRRSDVKIEAPPNLYDPVPGGGYRFYRNIWVAPGLQIWDARRNRWAKSPRLAEQTGDDGFAYLCIHPKHASNKETILDFLRVLDLHLLNPGLHASSNETV